MWGDEPERSLGQQLRLAQRLCRKAEPQFARATDLSLCMQRKTYWPSADELTQLDSAVRRLYFMEGRIRARNTWPTYELVDKRYPRLRLIWQLNSLVGRAELRLKEGPESLLFRLSCQAIGTDSQAKQARAFVQAVDRIRQNSHRAATVKWEQFEQLLFQPTGEPFRELASKLPGPPRIRCYAMTLELIIEDQKREDLLKLGEPLLEWVAKLGNPAYAKLLQVRPYYGSMAALLEKQASSERAKAKRLNNRERQKRFRIRKDSRSKNVTPSKAANV